MYNSLSLFSALILGAMHALEPGHGKSILSSYIISQDVRWKEILRLLGTIFVTHFSLLFILAFVLMHVHSDIITQIQQYAPLLIVCFGVFLIAKRLIQKHSIKDHNHTCACDGFHNNSTLTSAGFVTSLIPCPTVLSPVLFALQQGYIDQLFFYLFLFVLGMIGTMALIFTMVVFSKSKMESKLAYVQEHIDIHLLSAVFITLVGLGYWWF
jgi:nickel/cobalt transporter (NicO) family protein